MTEKNDYVKTLADEILNERFDEICDAVNAEIAEMKDDVRTYLSLLVGNACDWGNDTPHFKWKSDGCPYDHSGVVEQQGNIDQNITIGAFFDEYTGERRATFESGHGWNYISYSEALTEDIPSIEFYIMKKAIKKKVDSEKLSQDDWFDLMDEIHDPLYDNTDAGLFFFPEALFDGYLSPVTLETSLSEFLKYGRPYRRAFKMAVEKARFENVRLDSSTLFDLFMRLPKIVPAERRN